MPASRSTNKERRGTATISMSWRTVATLCSSRLSIVGGPSGIAGKNDGARRDALGVSSAAPRSDCGSRCGEAWVMLKGDGCDADAGRSPADGPEAGRVDGGGGGTGWRGWLTRCAIMTRTCSAPQRSRLACACNQGLARRRQSCARHAHDVRFPRVRVRAECAAPCRTRRHAFRGRGKRRASHAGPCVIFQHARPEHALIGHPGGRERHKQHALRLAVYQ